MRLKALLILLKAYSPKNPSKFSLKEFSSVLAFEDFDSTSNFLEYHGLGCDFEVVYLDKRNFYHPDFPYTQERSLDLVESKRNLTVGEIINGSPYTVSQMLCQTGHQLQNSFDENGYLKPDTFDNILISSKTQEPESVFKVPQMRTVSPRPKKILESTSKFELTIPSPSTIPVTNKNDSKIDTHPSMLLTPPQSGSSESTSMNSGFNFLKAFETKPKGMSLYFMVYDLFNSAMLINIFLVELLQPETDRKPQTIIFFPTIDFKTPTTNTAMRIEQTPESTSTDSLQTTVPSPFTPYSTPSSTASNLSATEDTMKAIDIKFKLDLIQDSAMVLSNELVNEVTSEMILSCAKNAFTRNQQLTDTVPKQLLSNLIDELLSDTLAEVGEAELLAEQILEARKLRNLYKVLKHWIFITKRNVYRKQQLISAPIYIDNSPLSVVAEEFRHPNQRKSSDLAKDQLNHTNVESHLCSRSDNNIDLLKIVGNEFKFKKVHYWKAIVSIPEDNEGCLGKFPVLIENWLKSAFSIENASNTVTIKQYIKKLNRDLALCIQMIKGCTEDDNTYKIKSASGLIFVANHQNLSSSKKRLNDLILKLSNRSLPIAIIICNNNGEHTDEIASYLNLNDKGLKKYKVILHSSKTMNLKVCVEEGLRYIASNLNKAAVTLEMDLTETCLSKTVGEEFWRRVLSTISENEALWEACKKDCTFLVNVFNKALDHLSILLGQTFDEVVMFPTELQQYVGDTNRKFPLSIEYFPSNWRETRNVGKLKESLKSLHLPPFGRNPSKNLVTLKEQIDNYVQTVLGDVKNVSRLVSLAQMYISSQSDDVGIDVSWAQIIQLIAIQTLQENIAKIAASTPFVVYDYADMFKFINEPWWLTMDFDKFTQKDDPILDNATNEIHVSRKRKSIGDASLTSEEVSKILKTGEETLKKIELRSNARNVNHPPNKNTVVSVFQEAESYFEKNKILWKSYEEKLFGSP